MLYVLARHDGTVGKGVFQQWRYLEKKGVPSAVMLFADEGGHVVAMGEHEGFRLEELEDRNPDDASCFAMVQG